MGNLVNVYGEDVPIRYSLTAVKSITQHRDPEPAQNDPPTDQIVACKHQISLRQLLHRHMG